VFGGRRDITLDRPRLSEVTVMASTESPPIPRVMPNVRFGSKADIGTDQLNFRFTLKSGHCGVRLTSLGTYIYGQKTNRFTCCTAGGSLGAKVKGSRRTIGAFNLAGVYRPCGGADDSTNSSIFRRHTVPLSK
jgi:hypothetical protein